MGFSWVIDLIGRDGSEGNQEFEGKNGGRHAR
jgi:hypothetical protein